MKISMWIVNDWLDKYETEARINDGSRTINGVRYLADDMDLNRDYLYIGYTEQFILSETHNVICVNGTDIILIKADNIYVIFNEMQQMLEYYNTWETNILHAINSDASINDILDYAGQIMKTRVVISDSSLKLLGESRNFSENDIITLVDGYLPLDELHIINEQLRINANNTKAYPVNTSHTVDINKNLYSKDKKRIGWLVALSSGGKRLNSNLQIVEAFSELIDIWFKMYMAESSSYNLFSDVLEMKETDSFNIKMRLEGLGWGSDPSMMVIVLRACQINSIGTAYLGRYMESFNEGISSFPFKDYQIMVVNTGLVNTANLFTELSSSLRTHSAYAGVSFKFTDCLHISNALSQAVIASDYGKKQAGSVNHCSDYALEYIQDMLRSSIDIDLFSPSPEILKKYDAACGTEYYKTLRTYLACQGDQTLTAKELNIHRNSLLYRIKKIEELIDNNLKDPRERFYLEMTFFVNEPAE